MQPTYYVKHPDDTYSEANPQPLIDPQGNFEAKRLRRLAMLLGLSVPESDEALLGACGSVLGAAERVIEDTFHKGSEIERLRETLRSIADADWRRWEELASPEEFVRWAKSRANHALMTPNLEGNRPR